MSRASKLAAWVLIGALLAASTPASVAAVATWQEPGAAGSQAGAESIQGRVLAEGNRPVEGALVTLYSIERADRQLGTYSATTSNTGQFSIVAPLADEYELVVESPPLIVVDGIPRDGVRRGSTLTIRMAKGGVITGRVTDSRGVPVTGQQVRAILVRNAGSSRTDWGWMGTEGGITDDRGVYRLWGMSPGTYLVAIGSSYEATNPGFLSDRVTTYHPSSSRANASEVSVRLGEEVAGVNIVFRDDIGHRIAGSVSAAPSGARPRSWRVSLHRPGVVSEDRSVGIETRDGANSFVFESVEDGDYELAAAAYGEDGSTFASSERSQVKLRGADVEGVRLSLLPTAAISGRVELAKEPTDSPCDNVEASATSRPLASSDVSVGLRRASEPGYRPTFKMPKSDGSFEMTGLGNARYRLWVVLKRDDLYVVQLDRTLPVSAGSGRDPTVRPKGSAGVLDASTVPVVSTAARDGVTTVRGATVAGFKFVLARGAARVRGRIAPAKAGDPLPLRARVCFVSADPKQKDDVIHYFEVLVERDGTFDVRNVAPGEYFVATRTFPGDDRPDIDIFPAAWDAAERLKLYAAAEKAGVRITLSPCQRLESAVITLTQSISTVRGSARVRLPVRAIHVSGPGATRALPRPVLIRDSAVSATRSEGRRSSCAKHIRRNGRRRDCGDPVVRFDPNGISPVERR